MEKLKQRDEELLETTLDLKQRNDNDKWNTETLYPTSSFSLPTASLRINAKHHRKPSQTVRFGRETASDDDISTPDMVNELLTQTHFSSAIHASGQALAAADAKVDKGKEAVYFRVCKIAR